MDATTIGVDLAKTVFELALAHAAWRVTERKRLTRNKTDRTDAAALLEAVRSGGIVPVAINSCPGCVSCGTRRRSRPRIDHASGHLLFLGAINDQHRYIDDGVPRISGPRSSSPPPERISW